MQGEISILDKSGDTKVIWDSTKPDEVEVAKDTFTKLKKKGYLAFEFLGKDGSKGKQVKEFDPDAERIIMSPAIVGG